MNKKNHKERRSSHLTIRCSRAEYAIMRSMRSKTTCRSFSEYARKVLMGKPVATTFRNVSLDALIGELNELRGALELVTTRHPGPMETELVQQILHEVKLIGTQITEQCIPK